MNNNSATEMLNTVCDNITRLAAENSVCDKPIIGQNGEIIIPVSDISIGFAAGGSGVATVSKAQKAAPAGGGGKLQKRPKALLLNRDGSFKIEAVSTPSSKPTKLSTAVNFAKNITEKIKLRKTK